jgi:hypothetical protein
MSDVRKSNTGSKAAAVAVKSRMEFRVHSGSLCLYIDNKPTPAVVVPAAQQESEASLRVLRIPELCWAQDGGVDTDQLNEFLNQADASQDVLMLEITVDAPRWWRAANPIELACGAVGGALPAASYASLLWRKDAGNALRRLLRAIKAGPHGDRIGAVTLKCGHNGTWGHVQVEALPDTSQPMKDAFRRFASVKYRRNEGLLRRDWFDARAEFTRITCPDSVSRNKSDIGVFRNPHRSRKLLDFYEVMNEEQNDAILHFAGIVKDLSGGSVRVGVPAAAFKDISASPEFGRAAASALLDSDLIDYFVEERSHAGFEAFCPPAGSTTLAGKYRFVDYRALSPLEAKAAVHSVLAGAGAITYGEGASAAYTASRALLNGRAVKKTEPDTAIILDTTAPQIVVKRPDCADLASLVLEQLETLYRSGAGFQVYLMSDTFKNNFPNHKVIFMPNCWYLSEPERRTIDARFKRSDQTVVWFWAPGVAGEGMVSAELGSRCCSQKLRLEIGLASLRTRVASGADPVVWGRHQGEKVGSEQPAAPIITVSDKTSIRLGANADNKTTFSVQRFKSWTSIVTGTLPTPPDIIRNIVRSAGCHQYVQGVSRADILTSSPRSIGYTSSDGGMVTLFLPGEYDVTDLVSGKRIGQGLTEFGFEAMPGNTAAFELKPHIKE